MNTDLGRRGGCTFYFPAGLIILLALMLAACATPPRPASVYQGECRVFEDPGFRVRGLRSQDNRWIATTQEVGIQVCGWRRPPNMPESAAFACADVNKAVQLFGGDVAKAEAYAVSQGATPEQIVAARACLAPTTAVKGMPVKAPAKKRWFSRKTAPTAVVETVSAPTPAPTPVSTPTPATTGHILPTPAPTVVAPVAPVLKHGRVRSGWANTKAKTKKGWERVKKPFKRGSP